MASEFLSLGKTEQCYRGKTGNCDKMLRWIGPRPVPGRSGHKGARAFKLLERVRRFLPAARRDVARSWGCGSSELRLCVTGSLR